MSYVGALVNCEHECLYPLYVSTNGGAPVPVVYDDALKEAAWSPDGSTFADVEGGGEPGIWTYGSEFSEPPARNLFSGRSKTHSNRKTSSKRRSAT